jgi:hypothetical protein
LRPTLVPIIYGTSEAKFAVAIWGAEGRDKIMGGQNLLRWFGVGVHGLNDLIIFSIFDARRAEARGGIETNTGPYYIWNVRLKICRAYFWRCGCAELKLRKLPGWGGGAGVDLFAEGSGRSGVFMVLLFWQLDFLA